MARPANDRIGTASPPDQVAAAVAAHDIAAIARGGDDIIALMPDQDIATVAAVDTVSAVASEDLIGVIAPHQPIMSRPADDSILSGAPLDKVCLLAPLNPVAPRPANEIASRIGGTIDAIITLKSPQLRAAGPGNHAVRAAGSQHLARKDQHGRQGSGAGVAARTAGRRRGDRRIAGVGRNRRHQVGIVDVIGIMREAKHLLLEVGRLHRGSADSPDLDPDLAPDQQRALGARQNLQLRKAADIGQF